MNAARSLPNLCRNRRAFRARPVLLLDGAWQRGVHGAAPGYRHGGSIAQATQAGLDGTNGSNPDAMVSWLSYQAVSASRCLNSAPPSTPPMSTQLPPYTSAAPITTPVRAAVHADLLSLLVGSSSSSGHPEQLPGVDAIVVLAGGLTEDGDVPAWAARRLDAAADVHKLCAERGRQVPILCLGACSRACPALPGPALVDPTCSAHMHAAWHRFDLHRPCLQQAQKVRSCCARLERALQELAEAHDR